MFISQPPCGDACIFESSAAAGSHISTTAGVPADRQTSTDKTCQSTGFEQTEQCSTSLTGNSSQLQLPTSISSNTSEAHSTSLSSLLPGPDMSFVSSTCVSTEDAVGAEPFDTNKAKAQACPTALVQCADTHQPDMAVCAVEQNKQHSPAACGVEQGQQIGILRKKPGRGEPTLSMSCSDKLARWGLLGVQVPRHHIGLPVPTLCDVLSCSQCGVSFVWMMNLVQMKTQNVLLLPIATVGSYDLFAYCVCLHCYRRHTPPLQAYSSCTPLWFCIQLRASGLCMQTFCCSCQVIAEFQLADLHHVGCMISIVLDRLHRKDRLPG